MTDHPLTEEAVAERLDADARLSRWKNWTASGRAAIVSAFRAMFDAGREYERANPEDARPWEPLNGLPGVGYEVRQVLGGVTTTGVVARVSAAKYVYTAKERPLGFLGDGTWHVRRPAPELPPERDGVVLVPADGHKAITTANGRKFSRLTYSAELSMWYGPRLDAGPWEDDIQKTAASRLNHDTWKVADQ